MQEIRYIKFLDGCKSNCKQQQFELISRDNETVPMACAWSDLPRIASMLGFGAVPDIRDRLGNVPHDVPSIILDIDQTN